MYPVVQVFLDLGEEGHHLAIDQSYRSNYLATGFQLLVLLVKQDILILTGGHVLLLFLFFRQ